MRVLLLGTDANVFPALYINNQIYIFMLTGEGWLELVGVGWRGEGLPLSGSPPEAQFDYWFPSKRGKRIAPQTFLIYWIAQAECAEQRVSCLVSQPGVLAVRYKCAALVS